MKFIAIVCFLYFFSQISYSATPQNRSIILDGNSLTFGSGLKAPNSENYAQHLKSKGWKVLNIAKPGQTSEEMLRDAKTEVDTKVKNFRYVLFWEDVNSHTRDQIPAEKTYETLKQYVKERKEADLKQLF